MTDPKRLAEIRERAEKATKGPWQPAPDNTIRTTYSIDIEGHPCVLGVAGCGLGDISPENSEFIAHSREDIPWLLDRVAELEAKLKVAAEALERGKHIWHSDSDGCLAECKYFCSGLAKLRGGSDG